MHAINSCEIDSGTIKAEAEIENNVIMQIKLVGTIDSNPKDFLTLLEKHLRGVELDEKFVTNAIGVFYHLGMKTNNVTKEQLVQLIIGLRYALQPISQEELYTYYINDLRIPENYYKTAEEAKARTPFDQTNLFIAPGKRLVFVGGVHTVGDSDYTKFLEDLIKKERPNALLVEERKDIDMMERLRNIIKKEKATWTELDWLVNFSVEQSIPIKGMDLSSADQLKPYINHFGPDEGIKLAIFTNVMLDYKSPYVPQGDNPSIEDYYDSAVRSTENRFLRGNLQSFKENFLSLKSSPNYENMPVAEFVKTVVYEEAQKYVSDEGVLNILEDPSVYSPYPFVDKYKINKVWTLIDAARDAVMIDECVRNLRACNCIIAVADASHIQMMREYMAKALKKEFGDVLVSKYA